MVGMSGRIRGQVAGEVDGGLLTLNTGETRRTDGQYDGGGQKEAPPRNYKFKPAYDRGARDE